MALLKSPKTFSLSPSQLLTLLSDATVFPAGGSNLSWERGALSPSHDPTCARLQSCLLGTVGALAALGLQKGNEEAMNSSKVMMKTA